MSKRNSVKVSMEYAPLLDRIHTAPIGFGVDIVPRVTASVLAPRLSPIGSFYRNNSSGKTIFVKEANFRIKKGKKSIFLDF